MRPVEAKPDEWGLDDIIECEGLTLREMLTIENLVAFLGEDRRREITKSYKRGNHGY